MGRTKRHEPRDGEFKKLKASKKQRNKKQRADKVKLQKNINFASEHQANKNMTQLNAAMYMNKSTEADFDPSTFIDEEPNDETIAAMEEVVEMEEISSGHYTGKVVEITDEALFIEELHN